MNKKNILKLADLIETLPEKKFDMTDVVMESTYEAGQSCGSPSCIAGWAAWEQQGRPKYITDNRAPWSTGQNNLVNSALEYFGIDEWDEKRRVANGLFRGDHTDGANRALTKDDAVHALRVFAKTGEIEWPYTPEDYE